MWENLYKKPYQTWKNTQKASRFSNRNTEKRQILFHRLVGEHTLFLPILLILLKGEMKIGIIEKTG